MPSVPSLDDARILRHVLVAGEYRLLTWLVSEPIGYGMAQLGHAFYRKGETLPLFEGEDFGLSPSCSYDGDDSLKALLRIITLRKGDTDREYFSSYTEDQLAFSASSECEALQCDLCLEDSESEDFFADIESNVYESEIVPYRELSHETCNGHTIELTRGIWVF